MRSACLYGSSLGLCWAQVVPMLSQVGPMLSHLGPILGLCWAKPGPCWAILGPSWAYVGPSRAHVEPSGPSWAYVGPSRAHVEPSWAHLGLMLGQVGPMLSHRAHLGPILDRYRFVSLLFLKAPNTFSKGHSADMHRRCVVFASEKKV